MAPLKLCASMLAAISLIGPAAWADEVWLTNGSKIIGTVTELGAEGLVVETDFAGVVKLDRAKVAGVSADKKLTVALLSGERVAGTLSYDEATKTQRVTGTSFGDVATAFGKIAGVWPVGAAAPAAGGAAAAEEVQSLRKQHAAEIAAIQQANADKLAGVEAEYKKFAATWKASIEFGLDGQSGNTERLAFSGEARALRSTPTERLSIFIGGQYAEENNNRTVNEILGGIGIEHDISPKWFVFGKLTMEYDEQEELDLRSVVSAGLGHWLIRKEGHELKARAGLGYQHESFEDGTSTDQAVIELGYDYLVELTPWLLLTHGLTYYPAVDDPLGDYRVVTETAGAIPLGDAKAWKVKLGVKHEYDSEPRPGVDSLDTYYFLNLVYDFLK